MTNPLKAITNLVKTKSVNSTEKKANSNIDVAQPTKRSGSLAQAKSTGRPFQAKMERMSSSKNIKTLVKNLGAQQKEARKQENLVLTKRAAVQKMGGLLNSLRTDKKYAGNEQKLNKNTIFYPSPFLSYLIKMWFLHTDSDANRRVVIILIIKYLMTLNIFRLSTNNLIHQ